MDRITCSCSLLEYRVSSSVNSSHLLSTWRLSSASSLSPSSPPGAKTKRRPFSNRTRRTYMHRAASQPFRVGPNLWIIGIDQPEDSGLLKMKTPARCFGPARKCAKQRQAQKAASALVTGSLCFDSARRAWAMMMSLTLKPGG